jgi:hypothetical protein
MKPRRAGECLSIPPRLSRSQIAPAGFAIQQPGGGLPVAQQCRKSAASKNGIYWDCVWEVFLSGFEFKEDKWLLD